MPCFRSDREDLPTLDLAYHQEDRKAGLCTCMVNWMFARGRIHILLTSRRNQIQWERRFENWEETVPSCSVDGVDFWVPESHPFSRGDYSHKLNHAGLRYHVALALGTSFIVHVAGGVPAGSWPDLRLARECLVPLLRPGEMVAADRGYRDGALYFLTPVNRPISLWQRRLNRSIRLIQARHEHVNKRLDDFSVLGEMFRHSRRQHRLAFAACAMLTQVNLIEEPLVDVRILLRRRQ